jgi:4-carboxymuconolactone decarboxylase
MSKKELPGQYRKLKEKYGDFLDAVSNLGEVAKKEGPIDVKTAHLIQLGAAVAIRSEGSVHSHVRRALEAGASPDEIYHAIIILTSTIGFPTVSAALSWADDVID